MAGLWYITMLALCCMFLNKVLKVYEVDKFQNNCTIYH